jgi:hypothetical protein
MPFVAPNLWVLSGGSIQIRYSSTAANFHYHDSSRNLTFTGSEIRSVNVPDLGTLVSVTTLLTVDSGSTTFTVLLPITNLNSTPGSLAPVTTNGIATAHHFSVLTSLLHGQIEFYSITPLTGTAYHL